MKVAGYFRESSADKERAPPIEKQIERFRQWAIENKYEVVAEYVDDGFSGGDWNRPQWNQGVKDAKRHLYQILWVWNQDRIARDTEQFLWFNRNLKDAKVQIWEDTSNSLIDTDSLGNKIKHTTLAQAGEIFRLVTSEKVKQAYRRKIAKGETWGRRKLTFDFALAEKLRSEGLGWRTIAKKVSEGLEKPISHLTVRRVLQNKVIMKHPEILEKQSQN